MKKILLILFITSSLFAKGCWNTQENADMFDMELDEKVIFSFKDAVTCEPVNGAKVKFLGVIHTTNQKGQIEVPIPRDDLSTNIPIHFEKKGYINLTQNILASVGSYWNTKFLVSKELPINSIRFVLSWGDKPKDLDLHLVSENFHISFRKTKSIINEVKLDRDSRKGYGAETITLDEVHRDQTYKLYVYNFSNEKKFSGKANVAIYKNNSLDKVVSIDKNSRCVEVAEIHDEQINYTLKSVSNKYCK
jgi:hypothetical protein